MVNTILAAMVLAATAAFYVIMEDAMRERHTVTVEQVPMWYCEGWTHPIYPTERSMRKAFSE